MAVGLTALHRPTSKKRSELKVSGFGYGIVLTPQNEGKITLLIQPCELYMITFTISKI